MRVGIIGSSDAALRLGRHWQALGHEVWFGLQDGDSQAIHRVGCAIPHAEIADPEDAAGADVVVMAVPGDEALVLASSLGDLEGRVVMDCSWGPHDQSLGSLSRAEAMQMIARNGRVVRVVPQGGWDNIHIAPTFVCGDEPEAVEAASQLLRGVTERVVPLGQLDRARNIGDPPDMLFGLWSGLTALA